MAFKLYNKTLLSTPDTDHNTYWADFEYSNFSEGRRKYVFLGVLNGNGPRTGDLCAIKTFKDRVGDHDDWNKEICKCKEASSLAQQFNMCSADERRITFEVPVIAEVDMVSHCTQFIQKVTRRKIFNIEECVGIESYLKGNFQRLNSNSSLTNPAHYAFAQAFSHFTYWYTNGRLVVTDLQGVVQTEHYRLTDPTLHSVNRAYGATDKGHDGIRSFLSRHRCNKICANWFLSQQQ